MRHVRFDLQLCLLGSSDYVCFIFNLRILYRTILAVSRIITKLIENICSIDGRAMATMRGTYVPEEGKFGDSRLNKCNHFLIHSARATIMNYFRIPLNLIVVIILLKVRPINSYKSLLHFPFFRISI